MESYVQDGYYLAGMNLLSINSNITSSYSQEELSDLMTTTINVYGPFGQDIKCAAVFAKPLQYGLGRMFQVATAGSCMSFGPFYDLSEALNWLEIPDSSTIDTAHPQSDTKVLIFQE